MAGQLIADLVLAELDAIVWGDEALDYPGKTWPAIAKGIHSYFDDSDNYTLTTIGIGIVTPPLPAVPFPLSEPNGTTSMTVPPKELLLPNLQTMSTGGLTGFFGAINVWLSVPPWVILTTNGIIVTGLTAATIATYPAFASMGIACQSAMMAANPNTKEDAWKIIGDFIYTGISTNMIPPTTGVGAVAAGPWMGMVNSVLTWS